MRKMRLELVLVTVAALVRQSAGSFDYLSPRTIAFAQQQGPNTCVVEEVPGTLYQLWTECRYWPDRHICGQKATIRYNCCEGYFRVNSEHGCTGVEPLSDVIDTARRSGAARFADLLETSGVADELRRAGPGVAFTLFAPNDQVMDNNGRILQSEGALSTTLLYHIVETRYPTKRWQADQLVETRLPGASVRLNKFSSKIETVNCAMVTRKDREATNGIVHIIDDILRPDAANTANLLQVLQRDGRFRQLLQLLQQSPLMKQLQEQKATFTLLAPNDEAFQKVPVSLKQRLLTNQAASEALLAHLVITQPVCRPAVTAPHKLGTRGGQLVEAECDTRGVRVQGNRLGEMLLASNGIIYMLDDVPVPDSALSLLQLLGRMHLYSFLDLVRIAELENFFDDAAAVELTLFAPSELAMSSIPYAELTHLRSDASAARRFVLQHLTRGIHKTDSFTDNQVVRSAEDNVPLRLQVYRRGLGVETAMIEDQRDRRALNGIVHVVSAVIRPADRTLREHLQQDGNFTMFLRALDAIQADEPGSLHLGRGVSGYSVLAPTDEAFKRLSYDTRNAMFDDRRMLKQIVQRHFLNKMMPSTSMKEDLKYEVPSHMGKVRLQRKGDAITVDDATATRCDHTTLDGLVHVINKVLWSDNVTWGSSATYPPPLMAGRGSSYSSSSSSRRFTNREEVVH